MMMITRSRAVPQVIGFLSMENGLIFAATAATNGMPMIVEFGIALDVLVGILILGVFMFQIREQFDSLDIHHLESSRKSESAERLPRRCPRAARLAPRESQRTVPCSRHPGGGAGHGTEAGDINVALQPGHLPGGLRADGAGDLRRPTFALDRQLFIDPLNVFLVTLTAFVGLPHRHLLAPLHAQRATTGR